MVEWRKGDLKARQRLSPDEKRPGWVGQTVRRPASLSHASTGRRQAGSEGGIQVFGSQDSPRRVGPKRMLPFRLWVAWGWFFWVIAVALGAADEAEVPDGGAFGCINQPSRAQRLGQRRSSGRAD